MSGANRQSGFDESRVDDVQRVEGLTGRIDFLLGLELYVLERKACIGCRPGRGNLQQSAQIGEARRKLSRLRMADFYAEEGADGSGGRVIIRKQI